jgi:hypothetical protein
MGVNYRLSFGLVSGFRTSKSELTEFSRPNYSLRLRDTKWADFKLKIIAG